MTVAGEVNRVPKTEPRVQDGRRGKPVAQARHELLTGVRQFFLKTRKVENDILRPFKRLLVDVMSSEPKLDDVLKAAQALFEAMTARGLHVGFAPVGEQARRAEVELLDKPASRSYHRAVWAPEHPTVVYVANTPIGLTLFEMTEEVEVVYVNGKYVPIRDLSDLQLRRYTGPHHWRSKEEHASGRLCLQAYCPSWQVEWSKRWQETKPGTFDEMIPAVVLELEAVAPELSKQVEAARLRAEEEYRRWEDERRKREVEAERARREKARQDSRTDLLAAIAAWDEVRRVRDYFVAIEAQTERLSGEEAEAVRERLRLAKELVGDPDALTPLRSWKAPNER